MATFLELKNRVLVNVIDLTPAVTAAVPRLVNNAIRSMQREHNYRAMEGGTLYITSTGNIFLGSVSNFKEYRDLGPFFVNQRMKSTNVPVIPVTEVRKTVLLNTSYPGRPELVFDTIDATTGAAFFFIAPYPDTNSDWNDGNYQIFIPYYTYSADLVNDGDTNWFTLNAADYIEYQATAEGFQMDWDNNSMALWLQRADTKKKEIKKADKMQRLGTVDTFVPIWRGANQPRVRR